MYVLLVRFALQNIFRVNQFDVTLEYELATMLHYVRVRVRGQMIGYVITDQEIFSSPPNIPEETIATISLLIG